MKVSVHIELENGLVVGNDLPMVLIAGPCQMESQDHAIEMAHALSDVAKAHHVPLIFKSSFDKANRSSIRSTRGIGFERALPVFQEIKKRFRCPVLTDVHTAEQCLPVSEVVDIIQIPAFLCRQTDLVIAAAETGKVINVKKGQFLAPWDMKNIIEKIEQSGNRRILLTERGVSFGYNTLIVDPRSIPVMARTGYPTVIDATHAVQQPGGLGDKTGGDRAFAPVIARSAVANCVAAVFIETHQDPDHAPSDGPNMIPLHQMGELIHVLKQLDQIAKMNPLNL